VELPELGAALREAIAHVLVAHARDGRLIAALIALGVAAEAAATGRLAGLV
jgi:hypothetical protein